MNLRIIFRKLTQGLFPGEARSTARTFKGLEFREYKTFDPRNDPPRAIDIRASLKKRELLVRTMEAEKTFPSFFLLDFTPSVDFISGATGKRELALYFMKILAAGLVETSSHVGLFLFPDEPPVFRSPKFGLQAARKVIAAAASFRPGAGKTDFVSMLDFAAMKIRRPSMIFILTDGLFEDPSAYRAKLAGLSVKHDILVLIIRDRREAAMPRLKLGMIGFRDMETGEVIAGDRIKPDNRLAETCAKTGIACETFFADEPEKTRREKLAGLLSKHAKRRGGK